MVGLSAKRLWVFVVGVFSVVGCSEVTNPSEAVEVRLAVKENFDNLDSPYPMTDRGMIHVIFSPRFAGATLELVDATGQAFYKDEEDNWSADLEATASGGIGRERCCAEGGFVEVVPGEHQVEIGGSAQDCALQSAGALTQGWPGNAPNRFLVPVREGFSTRIVLLCPPPL